MKLDLDAVRSILIAIEATPANQAADEVEVDGLSEDEVLEYIELLEKHGLIKARLVRSGMGGGRIYSAFVERLTFDGHEFLNAARNDTVWNKTKAFVASKGGGIGLDVLKALLIQQAKELFLPGSSAAE